MSNAFPVGEVPIGACGVRSAQPAGQARSMPHRDLTAPRDTGPSMNEPPEPKRWISLGLLFGGPTPSCEVLSPTSAVSSRPVLPAPPAPLATEEREGEEAMRAAGYEPKVRFPGARSMPWPSECTTCGAPRKPSLQDVERGVRCQHVRGRRSVPSRA